MAFLLALTIIINNSVNKATGKTPTELIYGFRLTEGISLLGLSIDYDCQQRIQFHQEAIKALTFANAIAKIQYDKTHLPLFLKPGDITYLQLHHSYTTAGKPNCKLGQQWVRPFKIIHWVGCLIYELNLPSNFCIHPVILVAQLEPTLSEPNPYEWPQPDHLDAVMVNSDMEEWRSYEIEWLLDKCQCKYAQKSVTKYLVW